jgi:hypothetical protein
MKPILTKTKELSDGRVAVLTANYSSNNDGAAFSRNYGGTVHVDLYIESDHDLTIECPIVRANAAREVLVAYSEDHAASKAEASKVARAYIREHDLRGQLKALK